MLHPRSLTRHKNQNFCGASASRERKRKLNLKDELMLNHEKENSQEINRCTVEGCSRVYYGFDDLQKHCQKDHGLSISKPQSENIIRPVVCGCCEATFPTVAEIGGHIRENKDHWDPDGQFGSQPYSASQITLDSVSTFDAWKEKSEIHTNENFTRVSKKRAKQWRLDTYFCCRTGKSRALQRDNESALPGTRCPSRTPNKKTGFHCSAFIKAKKLYSG